MNALMVRSIVAVTMTIPFFSTAAAGAPPGVSDSSLRDEPSVRVRFRDLDLSTSAGVSTLHRRIERAADMACKAARSPWQYDAVGVLERCKASAIAAAVTDVNHPLLTALHRKKYARPPS